MSRLVLALLAGVFAAMPAIAALHKCTTKEGKTIYTEFECEGDARKADVTIRDSKGVDTTKGGSPIKSVDPRAGTPKAVPSTISAPTAAPSAAAPDKSQAAPPK